MSPLYYICSLAIALVLVFSALTVSDAHKAASRLESASEVADTKFKRMLEWLSLGLYRGAREKLEKADTLNEIAAYHQRRVSWSSWLLVGVSTLFVAVKAGRARSGGRVERRRLAAHLLGVSAVFLFVGLIAPMLTVSAHREVTLLGDVVFQYESRSILGTAEHLARGGSLLVAALLFLFSVVIPVAKLALSFLALSNADDDLRRGAFAIIRLIGRWSMTDVFVVAVLLAFLSAESNGLTDAAVGPGLYFFAGYGVISLAGGQMLIRQAPPDVQ